MNPTHEQIERAREDGRSDAQRGFTRYDYPIDYSEAERDAWRRGWDEYQEGRE